MKIKSSKIKPTILYISDCGQYTAWFQDNLAITGQATNLGKAIWYLIEKSHEEICVKEYVDPLHLEACLSFCVDTGKIEHAKKYAASLGRKLSKDEERLCITNFHKKQAAIIEYWEKRKTGQSW